MNRLAAFLCLRLRQTAVLPIALLSLLPCMAHGETIKVATGEYPPFVSEQRPELGVMAAIVTAALKSQGIDARYDFLPWRRAYYEASLGKYIGTFPYVRNPEREVEFLYSDVIYTDRVRLFVRSGNEKARDWLRRSVCVPIGYDATPIQAFVTEHKIRLETPAEMSNCIKMLAAAHVDAVWVSETVAADMANALLGKNSKLSPAETGPNIASDYSFIVARSLPEAQRWLTRFNKGLQTIQSNGSYKKIVARFAAR